MNREILFRGKRETDGEWLYGLYSDARVHETDFPRIMPLMDTPNDNDWAIIPETVGQYTGLIDKNDKKIFEGDILAVETSNISVECDGYFKVGYDNGTAAFVCEAYNYCITFDNVYGKDVEVVGNVFDNPELIEEREENV